MIDIHCHLLPGIDDGAPDMPTALSMARYAVENGIEKIVLTPHIQPGLYENTMEGIQAALAEFRLALEEEGISIEARAAAEVRIMPEIRQMLLADELPFLGELNGYKVFLLEFPHSHIPPGSDRLIDWLLNHDIRPMIAHPERNKDVIRKFEKIAPFVSAGCLLQVTANSVAGRFGEVCQQRSREMLERGWVTVLASDSHNLNHRVPELEPGRRAAAEVVGEQEASNLVNDNPWSIVKGLFE